MSVGRGLFGGVDVDVLPVFSGPGAGVFGGGAVLRAAPLNGGGRLLGGVLVGESIIAAA